MGTKGRAETFSERLVEEFVETKRGFTILGMNSLERGSSADRRPVFEGDGCACVWLAELLPAVPFMGVGEGENSGVLGLSLEDALLGGERGCVGLNTGAEGLSVELGGEISGVVGLIDELLLS